YILLHSPRDHRDLHSFPTRRSSDLGMNRTEALVHGCRERLRPILMTTFTTVLAMLPPCIGGTQLGGDGPAYYPLARAIAGGLLSSRPVSLQLLPTIYALLDDLRILSNRLPPWAAA